MHRPPFVLLALLGSLVPVPAQEATRPLAFEPATDPGCYLARGAGYAIRVAADGVSLRLLGPEGLTTVALRLVGAPPRTPQGEAPLPGRSHYLAGDRSRWRTAVPHFARTRCPQVYPGIDFVLHGSGQRLEYDFEVAPGADPGQIELAVADASLTLAADGALVISLPGGRTLTQSAPVAWQEQDGKRQPIAVGFVLRGDHAFGFRLGAHDPRRPLTIDPVLGYASYLGGNGMDRCTDVAVDASGAAYLTGITAAANFPTTGSAFDPSLTGLYDAFVTKVSPDGTAIVWSTYLGGSGAFNTNADLGVAIGVDALGRAVVLGHTDASDFPIANAAQPTLGGSFDAFVTMLTPDGQGLVWSTFLGGSGDEITARGLPTNVAGGDVAVRADGTTYVFGNTTSADFPTRNARQATRLGSDDAFLTCYTPAGQVVFSTYLGGSYSETGRRILLDPTGNLVLGGDTSSPDFPVTTGAYASSGAGFVTRIDATGQTILASTRFRAAPLGLAVDVYNDLYLAGTTRDLWFPVTDGAWQTAYTGAADQSRHGDGWVAKLDQTATTLRWCTYLGTYNVPDVITDIAVDDTGHVHALFNGMAVPGAPLAGAMVVKLANNGAGVPYQFRVAGTSGAGVALALAANGTTWLAGYSTEDVVPTTPGSFQPVFAGPAHVGDGWLARVDDTLRGVGTVQIATPKLARGTLTTGTVTIDGRAPAGGFAINLTATPPNLLLMPGQAFIPAGSSTATFPVTALPDAPRTNVTVTATAGTTSAATVLALWPGPSYRIVDLGPLTASEARSINNAGRIAGLGGSPGPGFLYDDASGYQSVGAELVAINEAGQACGSFGASALLYTPGTGLAVITPFAGVLGSYAEALNDFGHVVGWVETAPLGYARAFYWQPGVGMINLGTMGGGSASQAYGVNNRGEVCGESFVNGGAARRAFLYRSATGMADIGTLPGHAHATAYAINDTTEIAGISADSGFAAPHAFRWRAGTMRDLGTLAGDAHSLAYALNEHGQCVGFSAQRGAVNPRPFLFTDTTAMVKLQDLLDPDQARRFQIGTPRAIDDLGRMVGQGASGTTLGQAAYRLDPIDAAPYGHSCPGTGGRAPALCGEGSAARGEAFAFRVAGGLPGTFCALLLGTGNAATALGGGCDLLVSGRVLPPIALFLDAAGRLSLPLTIPAELPQSTVFAQALLYDPASGNGLLTATNGLTLALR